MNSSRYPAAAVALSLLLIAGCGGGGGGDDATTAPGNGSSPPEVTTYGDTNLPGRLLVTTSGPALLYDLRTGQPLSYPMPADTGHNWTIVTGGAMLSRVTNVSPGKFSVDLVSSSDWSRVGGPVTIQGKIRPPKASPDGKYLLTFWQAPDEPVNDPNPLTIFEVATGRVVKRSSRMSTEFVLGHPAAWLPDGRYIYLAGRNLYASTPTSQTEELLATYDLPDNSVFHDGRYTASGADLVVSPDGKKIAFEWSVRRANDTDDLHIWVANIDGSGLHRLTEVQELNDPLSYSYGRPTWSPDGKWIGAGLYLTGTTTAPIFPPDQSFPGVPGGIIGSTGCGLSPSFVLPVDAVKVPISWPTYDKKYGLKVRNASGTGGKWVSTCYSIKWLP